MPMPGIRRLLIANRGEIACRVIRTARRLGITSIAVFSDADRTSRHVALADDARRVGPAPARESYLAMEAILSAAREARADAIHPGYGFLSENAAFAAACERAGFMWVGPPASAIESMGSKSAAKEMMARAGVPVLPGYHGSEQTDAVLQSEAARVGYPVILKAVAGGGGKGMQIVTEPGALPAAIESARRIARSAFGSEALLLERYLPEPRHVEVQVFADRYGRVVHLFDRDCSVQRRHQKIIEEAPAPGLADDLRQSMADAAITVARTVGYVGAGTVEFLLDETDDRFYFMEMNTRLQVEHPVTESVTGLDLVEWQLRVAGGEALPAGADTIRIRGHAIEARIYAEDPARAYLPSVGRLSLVRWPAESGNLRIDSGVTTGDEVASHYDPLLAKVIAHGETRASALAHLRAALAEVRVAGVVTNAAFVARVLATDAFTAARLSTRLLEREHGIEETSAAVRSQLRAIAALWFAARRSSAGHSPWDSHDAWRLNLSARQVLWLRDGSETAPVEVVELEPQIYAVSGESGRRVLEILRLEPTGLRFLSDERNVAAEMLLDGRQLHVWSEGAEARFELAEPAGAEPAEEVVEGALATPLPGTVVSLEVGVGDKVAPGQILVVVEAMKMEHAIRAPRAGTVAAIRYRVGERVAEGVALVELAP
jgi:3-methylcrotonyl-CoA carboxylase alpha subunit